MFPLAVTYKRILPRQRISCDTLPQLETQTKTTVSNYDGIVSRKRKKPGAGNVITFIYTTPTHAYREREKKKIARGSRLRRTYADGVSRGSWRKYARRKNWNCMFFLLFNTLEWMKGFIIFFQGPLTRYIIDCHVVTNVSLLVVPMNIRMSFAACSTKLRITTRLIALRFSPHILLSSCFTLATIFFVRNF